MQVAGDVTADGAGVPSAPRREAARVASGRQLGLLWGGVAIALLMAAPWAERFAAALPACPLHAISGVPCPTCGSGGAAVALARFDLPGAFAASPLAALGWIALVIGGLAAGVAALRGHAVPEGPRRLNAWQRAAIAAPVLANWGYLILSR